MSFARKQALCYKGKAVLTVKTAERLADHLALEIVLRPKRGRSTRKGG